jgi:hypothetical protein
LPAVLLGAWVGAYLLTSLWSGLHILVVLGFGVMIVWWETYAAHELRGTVYDACPTCRCVQRLSLVDHVEIDHLYSFFQLRPKYLGASRTCQHCGYLASVNPEAYSGFLPAGVVETISVQQGVRRTNAALDEAFLGIADAKRLSTTLTYRQDGEDMHLPLEHAIEWIERLLFGGHDVHHLAVALGRWMSLPYKDKRELLLAVEETVREAGGTWNPTDSGALLAR